MAVSEEEMIVAVMDVLYPGWRENWSEASKAAEKNRMRRALEAADAVRGDAAPAGTVAVRVAVAFNADGGAHVREVSGHSGEEGAWEKLKTLRGAPIRSCIATIHAPLPAVPEVGAVVEGVDRG